MKKLVRRCPSLQALGLIADSKARWSWDVLAEVTAPCTRLVSLSVSYGVLCDAHRNLRQFCSLQVRLDIRRCLVLIA